MRLVLSSTIPMINHWQPYAEDVLNFRKICKINTKKKITYSSIAVIFISSAIALQYAGQTENIETSYMTMMVIGSYLIKYGKLIKRRCKDELNKVQYVTTMFL